jgi:predicted  nucleic acid-binding Zn-ribbon protein
MEVDFQFFFNSMAGVIAFFGGWVLKAFWERVKEIEEETDHLRDHHETDLKEARAQLNQLALALPDKYVSKGDFDNLVKTVHHRFDRLEEKIDDLPKKH